MKKLITILVLITVFNISYAQTNIFPGTGNVGIGTTNPTRLLDISSGTGVGPLKVSGPNGSLLIDNAGSGESYYQASRFHQFQGASAPIMTLLSGGNVGIGTANPTHLLDISSGTGVGPLRVSGPNGLLLIDNSGSGESYYQASRFHQFQGASAPIMTLLSGGNVGIGTVNPSSKLTVSGNIEAREVKVAVTAGADFVFRKDYALKPLNELESFINKNNHLPQVPDASEMEKDGINVSEMNIKLLMKIEELTLYLIQQQKEIELLKKDVKRQ